MRMSELLNEVNKFELDEGFSPKEIKMAIGVASDPRYAKGNMTGAVTAIEKLKKGLSDHPKVAAVLRRQNEDVKEAVSPAQQAAIAISKKEKTKNEVLDKDDEKTVGDVIKGLKKAVKAHQGQVKNLTKDIQDQVELDELTSDEKRLMAKMFDKKGNLTPLGKKVMDQGRKEEVDLDEVKKISIEFDFSDAGKKAQMQKVIDFFKKNHPNFKLEPKDNILKVDGGGKSLKRISKDIYNNFYVKKVMHEEVEEVEENALDENKVSFGGGLSKKPEGYMVTGGEGDNNQKIIGIVKTQKQAEKIRDDYNKKNNPKKPSHRARVYASRSANNDLKVGDDISWSRYSRKENYKKIKEDLDVNELSLDIQNESDYTLDEGKMKDLHGYISSGKSAEEIAKIMKIDAKTIKTLMNDFKKEGFSSDAQRKAAFASGYKEKDKKDKKEDVKVIEGYFPEQKSSTGYDLYHKDFSGAMQHAYAHAKKKLGITIDNDEIDDKVASGPRKPSKGKTNSYRLKGDKGSVQIQVYNMGSKFELNMYKESIDEEVELDEAKLNSKKIIADLEKGLSIDAIVGNHIDKRSSNKDEILKVIKDYKFSNFKKTGKKEEVEINEKFELQEASIQLVAKEVEKLAKEVGKKHMDYSDFIKVAKMMKSNQTKDVAKYVSGMDTDPRDEIIMMVKNLLGKKTAEKMFGVSIYGEEVKLDEIVPAIAGMAVRAVAKKAVGKAMAKKSGSSDVAEKLGGMPAGLSKERIKADRDVYAQVLGIKEALDPADFDIKATSKDRDNATKNIILQLRKVLSLNGKNPVEFSSGKKEKVHPNVAAAALTKFEKLRRTDQKDEFQQKIAKSYKDLLNAVKGK